MLLSTIFKKKESEIVAALSKVITTVEKEKDKLRIMFEYLYHLHARKRIISTTLTDIGFEVDEEASFQFFPENPYNKRKHAWLIKVHKPK